MLPGKPQLNKKQADTKKDSLVVHDLAMPKPGFNFVPESIYFASQRRWCLKDVVKPNDTAGCHERRVHFEVLPDPS